MIRHHEFWSEHVPIDKNSEPFSNGEWRFIVSPEAAKYNQSPLIWSGQFRANLNVDQRLQFRWNCGYKTCLLAVVSGREIQLRHKGQEILEIEIVTGAHLRSVKRQCVLIKAGRNLFWYSKTWTHEQSSPFTPNVFPGHILPSTLVSGCELPFGRGVGDSLADNWNLHQAYFHASFFTDSLWCQARIER